MSVNFGGCTSGCRRLGRVVADTFAFDVSGRTAYASGHTRASMVPTDLYFSHQRWYYLLLKRNIYFFVLFWTAVQCSNCLFLVSLVFKEKSNRTWTF